MLRTLPPQIEPDLWTLAFHKSSPHWWVRWLAFGQYKHVSAFAWIAPLRLWLVYDITLSGTRLLLLPDSMEAEQRIGAMIADADLVRMRRAAGSRPSIAPFYCVPVVKHLLGLRCGALLPTSLWRHCLANGGQPLHGAESSPRTDDQSRDPRPATAGRAGQD